MKIHLLIFCFFASIFSVSAQNPNLDFKFALKGYNQTNFIDDSYSLVSTRRTKIYQLDLFQPIASVQWQTKRKNAHEVALNYLGRQNYEYQELSISNSGATNQLTGGYGIRIFGVSATYEYLLNFNKLKETKFVPSLGFGINPYYNRTKRTDYFTSSTNIINTVGGKILIVPRIMYFLNSKLFLDLNTPFCLIDIQSNSYSHNTWQGPGQMDGLGRVDGVEFPRVYQLRLGLGLKL